MRKTSGMESFARCPRNPEGRPRFAMKSLLVRLLSVLTVLSAVFFASPARAESAEEFVKARQSELTALLKKPESPANQKEIGAVFDRMLSLIFGTRSSAVLLPLELCLPSRRAPPAPPNYSVNRRATTLDGAFARRVGNLPRPNACFGPRAAKSHSPDRS